MEIDIRLAVPADAPDMAKILSCSWIAAYRSIIPIHAIEKQNTARLALFQRIITNENDSHYIISVDGNSVGTFCIAPPREEHIPVKNDSGIDDSSYELHGIYLDPAFFRQGIGTAAMDFAIAKAQHIGKKQMILWVFEDNTNAIRFYQSCGFATDGAEKSYDYGRSIKCVRMRKTL